MGTLQVIAVTSPPSGTLAANTTVAHKLFIDTVKITTLDEGLEKEEVLDFTAASLINSALQHKRVDHPGLTDPYFTEMEWKRVMKDHADMFQEAERLLSEMPSSIDKDQWLRRKHKVPLCHCLAHESADDDFYDEVLGWLVNLKPPLNDVTGSTLTETLVKYILKVANLKRMKYCTRV